MSTKKPSYDKIIQALLTEPTKSRACEVVGISRSTLARYEKNSEFVIAYRKAVDEMIRSTTRKLQSESYKSAVFLGELRDNEEAPIQERRQAAKSILEMANTYTNTHDLMSRMAEIERAYNEEFNQ